jgi:hypothetical protein
MRPTFPHRRHRPEHAGEYLTRAAHFDARLDDITNPGYPHFVARGNDIEPSRLDEALLQNRLLDFRLMNG